MGFFFEKIVIILCLHTFLISNKGFYICWEDLERKILKVVFYKDL